MKRILISASFAEKCFARQTINASGIWDDCQFLFEPDGKPIDAWVVYDNLSKVVRQECPPANTLLVTGEPSSIRCYRSRFTSQFGHIWTSHQAIQHPNKLLQHEAQHWHFGLYPSSVFPKQLNFEDLVELPCPTKKKLLSVICSSKSITEDHRQRLHFVERLKQSFGNQLDVFGRGIRDVADKAEAILPYQYHVVLENDHSDFFITEKLPDAFLGWSLPFYSGGKSANRLLPQDSFIAIDMYQPEAAISIIRKTIESNTFQRRREQIRQARQAVLWHLNFFAMQVDFWKRNATREPARMVTLYPKQKRCHLVINQFRRWLVHGTVRSARSHPAIAIPAAQ